MKLPDAGSRDSLLEQVKTRDRQQPGLENGSLGEIPPAAERRITDPTGCGDAYRAGLIFGFMRDMDLSTVGRIASLMGALKIEHPGTQNQRFDYDEFAEQFRQQFGYSL